jgi:hypothetical protein
MRVFLLGAVKRAYEPGCKFDYMPVLIGGQGEGKSTFFKYLACNDAWYDDNFNFKNLDNKAVIEAMAIEGYYNVAPAYFETALKVKYSSDDDSARMFDMIRAGVTYDFGRVYSTAGLGSIPGKLRGMVQTDNINWMSTYESNIENFETLLADLVEKLGG